MNRTRGRRLITAVLAPAVPPIASCAAESDAPFPDLDAGVTTSTSDTGTQDDR